MANQEGERNKVAEKRNANDTRNAYDYDRFCELLVTQFVVSPTLPQLEYPRSH